jgi:ribosomal protein S18 acetylase RimI-like enzyme
MRDQQPSNFKYRPALPEDAAECVVVRGRTRQNAASEEWLRSIGITSKSWGENIRSGALPGDVCVVDGEIVGFCFGVRETGEIQVLAVLPDFENCGVGRELLDRTSKELAKLGHARLFLGCSPDPASRSYGFYRHLGWRSTGTFDKYGDEILEIFVEL